MSTLTIRQLDPDTHALLRRRAADNGRSVEAEVRAILDSAVHRPDRNLLLALRDTMAADGGAALDLPERTDQPRAVALT